MSEESKAIVQRGFEAWNTGDLALFDEIWAADYVHPDPAEPEVQSLEDYKRYVAYVHSRYPGLHFAVEDMLAEGDKVAARHTWRVTHTVGKEGRPPTGRQVSPFATCGRETRTAPLRWIRTTSWRTARKRASPRYLCLRSLMV